MQEGIVKIAGMTMKRTPDGWQCEDKKWADLLNTSYPPPDTGAGVPWILSFWEAVEDLRGTVIQRPEAEKDPQDQVRGQKRLTEAASPQARPPEPTGQKRPPEMKPQPTYKQPPPPAAPAPAPAGQVATPVIVTPQMLDSGAPPGGGSTTPSPHPGAPNHVGHGQVPAGPGAVAVPAPGASKETPATTQPPLKTFPKKSRQEHEEDRKFVKKVEEQGLKDGVHNLRMGGSVRRVHVKGGKATIIDSPAQPAPGPKPPVAGAPTATPAPAPAPTAGPATAPTRPSPAGPPPATPAIPGKDPKDPKKPGTATPPPLPPKKSAPPALPPAGPNRPDGEKKGPPPLPGSVGDLIAKGRHKSAWESGANVVHYGKHPETGAKVAVKYHPESDSYLVTDGKKIIHQIPRKDQEQLAKFLPDKVGQKAAGSTAPKKDPGYDEWYEKYEKLSAVANQKKEAFDAETARQMATKSTEEEKRALAGERYDAYQKEVQPYHTEAQKHAATGKGHWQMGGGTEADQSKRISVDERAKDKWQIFAGALKGKATHEIPDHYQTDKAKKVMFTSAPPEAKKTLTVTNKKTGEKQQFKVVQIHGHLLMDNGTGALNWTNMDELKAHLNNKDR